MGNYQDLIFYQKARHVVKEVDTLIKSWPKTKQAQEISRWLFRSAASVGANIAEGYGRHQGTEYVHCLIIAQGSANETEHWGDIKDQQGSDTHDYKCDSDSSGQKGNKRCARGYNRLHD